ncbi:MAG: hypothetical protein KDC38_15015, partial [Planctomycetes bacterium]|nr:hypothetical protein [Planctomycetota bacterium]
GNPVYLCEVAHHADSVIENHTLRRLLQAGTASAVQRAFAAEGFTHLLFDARLVFAPPGKTDLTLEEQSRLAEFLGLHAELVDREGTTLLYRIRGPERGS